MKQTTRNMLGMAAAVLLALTACNEEAAVMDTSATEPQNPPVADNSGNVYIQGDDFTWELGNDGEEGGGASSIDAVTRTALTIDGNTAKFAWTAGDLVGILPDRGAQVYFAIPTPEEGEEMTNLATFDGGAWALKAESDYAAYYPFVKDFDLDRTAVPVSYTGQKQVGATTAHLGAYDYQGARPSVTNGNGGVTFDFDHVGALVLLRFAVPTAGTQLTGATLSADGAAFTTAGTYDLTSTEGFPITATATSETFTVEMDYTTTADNEEVTLYFLCAPIDLSGKTVNFSVAYDEEGETIEFQCAGKDLQAAGGYLFKQPIDASAAVVTLEQETYIWKDNTEKKPAVTSVVLDGQTLAPDTDYTVSYNNNVYVGTASVIITFKGDYTGTVTKNFTIEQEPATGDFDGDWVWI